MTLSFLEAQCTSQKTRCSAALTAQEASVRAVESSPLFASGAEQRFCPLDVLNKKWGEENNKKGLNGLYTKHTFILIGLISYHCI